MKYRKLRIAWSVGWGVACLLLTALWVLSFWLSFLAGGSISAGRQLYLSSELGEIGFKSLTPVSSVPVPTIQPLNVYVKQINAERAEYIGASRKMGRTVAGVRSENISNGWGVATILLWPVLLAAGFAALPWFRWQFSLRTLLIATTLVAAVLGLIVLL